MAFVHQHLEECDSTNHALWELSEKVQLSEFHTISTDYQWSGRGQDTNHWHSEKNKNMLLSTLLFPSFLKSSDVFLLSQYISVSILDFLKSHSINDIYIKWPNDIYIRNQKIAGILIQNAISGLHINKSLVGIGFNLNQKSFPTALPNPTSLQIITGIEYQLLEEMHHLMSILISNYELLKKAPHKITKTYQSNLFQINEWASYKTNEGILEAQIIGVDKYGRLELENRRGVVAQFDLKEVKFIIV